MDREIIEEDILSLAVFCEPWRLVGVHLGLTNAQ